MFLGPYFCVPINGQERNLSGHVLFFVCVEKNSFNLFKSLCYFMDHHINIQRARQFTYKRNIEVRSHNYFCRERTISIAYSECVSVALFIQHAKRMRLIIVSSVACLTIIFFNLVL